MVYKETNLANGGAPACRYGDRVTMNKNMHGDGDYGDFMVINMVYGDFIHDFLVISGIWMG